MLAVPLSDRFSLLTGTLTGQEWLWLGAVAVEQGLTRGVLLALGGEGSREVLDAWLQSSLRSGLLVQVGATRAVGLTAAPSREPGVALAPELAQLVLRELARRGLLPPVVEKTYGLLAGRSVGDLVLALQSGDYRAFARRFSVERLPRQSPLRTAAEWLRVSVCEPFDAAWFESVWGGEAHAIALRVLGESLQSGSPCQALYAWLGGSVSAIGDDDARRELVNLLCQHALLRGEVERAATLWPGLLRGTALGFAAVAAFAVGDLALAQARLDEAFGTGVRLEGAARRALPQCGAVAPILGLLLCAREAAPATALAKRLLSVGVSDAERAAGRAFRLLLRYLDESESEHERIDVHDLGPNAGVWETLLLAHNAELHQKQPETRARFAQHLVRRALEYRAAGYGFVAEQALDLAFRLSPDYAAQELERLNGAPPRPVPSSLWELVRPQPEWQKTLRALSELTERAEQAAAASLRVAWYVDMADGSLSRPALCEHRLESGGWSHGRRLPLSELRGFRERLPPEDQRVLDATQASSERRDPGAEAIEQLIGHPRVYNGARGDLRVEVVAASCRVEAEEESDHLRIAVEPPSAKAGVNVVPVGEARLLVYRVSEAMQQVIELLPHGLRVPIAQKEQVLRVLGKLSQHVEVHSAALGAERLVEADATPCLRFAPSAGAWLVQAGVRPFGAEGRFFAAGIGRASLTFSGAGARQRCERDLERERANVDALVAACPTLSRAPEETGERARDEVDNWVLGEERVLTLLSELRACGVRHELEWPEKQRLRLRGDASGSVLTGRLRTNKGWYLATGGLSIDDVTEVTLAELVHAPALAGGRFVRLENGDYVELEERIRRAVAALAAAAARSRPTTELRLHPGAVSLFDALSEAGLELDADAKSLRARASEIAARSFPVPAELRAELRSYQVEGFRWLCQLCELGFGACLADDMGLGKTVQILALLLTRRAQGPALVVAPTSVCGNWAREAARFAPELEVMEYTGPARDAQLERVRESGKSRLVVTSYAILQQDQAKLAEIEWATAVLDEAQFIKNPQSLRAQAAFRLRAERRIVATGTPVENHAADLWSLFHFLNPGLLGELGDFNRRFVKPIERDGGVTAEAALRSLIRPYVLRRLKRDVLAELPPLTELYHEVELSRDETIRYAVLRKQAHEKLFTPWGKRQNKLEVLAEITRLRRFCCHPRLVFPDAELESSKIQAFLTLAEELGENQHRALVFSQFVDFLQLVRAELDERGISYEYLDGSTPEPDRRRRVDAFQHGSAKLFLISLKAGGFGLNLTAADYVIHLDPWWNPAVEAQATDRAHRIGQERPVTVYRLITRQTIEEKIVELHSRKRALSRSLLDADEPAAKLGIEELARLIEEAPV